MSWLQIAQTIISVLLVVVILMQSRGTGLGGTFGGGGGVYLTKRGLEKKLFILTIILAILFFLVSLARLYF
jgi:preprotein translocase subunit SecG